MVWVQKNFQQCQRPNCDCGSGRFPDSRDGVWGDRNQETENPVGLLESSPNPTLNLPRSTAVRRYRREIAAETFEEQNSRTSVRTKALGKGRGCHGYMIDTETNGLRTMGSQEDNDPACSF